MKSLKECPTELQRVPCLEANVQLTKLDIDSIKNNLKKIVMKVHEESHKLPRDVYDPQKGRLFYRDCRDIRYFLRQIEEELKHPREAQLEHYSFAALWLYGEQILLLREIGEFNGSVSRRDHPPARGTKTRSENLRENLASA